MHIRQLDLTVAHAYALSPIVLVTVLVILIVTNLSFRISFKTYDREHTPTSLPSFSISRRKGRDFRSLVDVSIAIGVKITKEPTFEENMFIY